MSAARSLGNLGNTNALTVDTANLKVGIVSTSPVGELQVGSAITMGSASGIISATAYYGDGANLENVASAGLGTAISSTKTEANNLIYYTNAVLGIGSTTTVVTPASTNVAYTQYTDIDVNENCDLIVADGDDFVPDVLGLSTAGISNISGAGGRIRAGQFVNNAGSGAPQLPYGAEIPVGYAITGAGGVNVSGIITTSGDAWVGGASTVGGVLTVSDSTESTSTSSGALVIVGGVGIGASLNVSGNITAGGTITYEDVTNQDVLGLSTYRAGLNVGSEEGSGAGVAITFTEYGNAYFGRTGVVTATTFSGSFDGSTVTASGNISGAAATFSGITTAAGGFWASGVLVESFSSTTTAWSSSGDLNITNGNLQFCSANLGGTTNTLNIISDVGINTELKIGQALNVTGVTSVSASTAYVNALKIDGVTTPVWWVGGSAPSDGGGSGLDTYSFNIIKTGDGTFHVIGNQVKTS